MLQWPAWTIDCSIGSWRCPFSTNGLGHLWASPVGDGRLCPCWFKSEFVDLIGSLGS
jgi:hypothetical protein